MIGHLDKQTLRSNIKSSSAAKTFMRKHEMNDDLSAPEFEVEKFMYLWYIVFDKDYAFEEYSFLDEHDLDVLSNVELRVIPDIDEDDELDDVNDRLDRIEQIKNITRIGSVKRRLWNICMHVEMAGAWTQNVCFMSGHKDKEVSKEYVQTFSRDLDAKVKLLDYVNTVPKVYFNPPVYVKNSMHYGTGIGYGLFALLPFMEGQLISQYTGKISLRFRKSKESGKRTRGYESKNEQRQNYCYALKYKGTHYIINPLDASLRTTYTNFASFMNEPSPPPYSLNDRVTYNFPGINDIDEISNNEKRDSYPIKTCDASISKYDYASGIYTLSADDGEVIETPPEYIRFKEKPEPDIHSYRANCTWFDFPVPIEMYTETRNLSDSVKEFELKDSLTCIVKFVVKDNVVDKKNQIDEVLACFAYFTDRDETAQYTHRHFENLRTHTILTLKDDVFDGMYRQCVIVQKYSDHILVEMTTNDDRWRLPQRIKAGKYYTQFIPFPLIYACKTISADEELLVMYSPEADKSRGLGCRKVQADDHFMKNEWDSICKT